MSTDATDAQQSDCYDKGCTEFIPKPVDGPRLLGTVERILGLNGSLMQALPLVSNQ